MADLGPLTSLEGIWEGEKGDDLAPSDDRGIERNKFRERITFVRLQPGPENHEQKLEGLRYSTTAWRLGEDTPFHEELGYWLWDAKAKQVMRAFLIPRGMTVLAGGKASADAQSFKLSAKLGSRTYGVCSNLFLDKAFKTIRYDLSVKIHPDGSWSYREDSVLKIKGQKKPFHHVDSNHLRRVTAD